MKISCISYSLCYYILHIKLKVVSMRIKWFYLQMIFKERLTLDAMRQRCLLYARLRGASSWPWFPAVKTQNPHLTCAFSFQLSGCAACPKPCLTTLLSHITFKCNPNRTTRSASLKHAENPSYWAFTKLSRQIDLPVAIAHQCPLHRSRWMPAFNFKTSLYGEHCHIYEMAEKD